MARPQQLALARAEQALSLGKIELAGTLCRAILARQPHPGAHHLLGLMAAKAGDFAGAEQQFRAAVRLDPRHADSHNNLGNALHQLGEPEAALACYEQALAQRPDFFLARFNQARVLQLLKRLPEALESYRLLQALRPDAHALFGEQGKLLLQLKRYPEAQEMLDRAVAADPSSSEAWCNRGAALHGQRDLAGALACYDTALMLTPQSPTALCNRGNVLLDLKRPEEALDCYDRTLALDPAFDDALCNRGNALQRLQRPAEALACYDRALAARPDLMAALSTNRGNSLTDLGRPEEALEACRQALAADPDYAPAHHNESHHRLLVGDFAIGWAKTRWRWKAQDREEPVLLAGRPRWDGVQPIAGKTLLLTPEQGLGDTIQFCRYAALLAERGARLVLQTQPGLKRLLRGLEDVDLVVEVNEAVPDFDLHCPLMNLPEFFATDLATIPARVPYLRAARHAVAKWDRRLGRPGRRRIGLVWNGNPKHNNDHKRSIPLATLLPLLRRDDHFVCLQKDISAADRAMLAGLPEITVLADEIGDFADTAAVVETLDLVISVDTSVAHLAGALARPVWIMVTFIPDWRWLLDRSDSPWYPTARLFRQKRIGDWAGVVAELESALAHPADAPV